MWKKIKAANEERAALASQMTGILDKCETRESKQITPEETVLFESLRVKSEELEKHIARLNQAAEAARLPGGENRAAPGRPPLGEGLGSGMRLNNNVAFGLEKRFCDAVPSAQQNPNDRPLSIGKFLRGVATGQWEGADIERRAMNEGTSSAGGVLVPTPLSGTIIDLSRNKARVMQAGAMTVPMDGATLKIARETGDVTASWKAESASFSSTAAAFDSVTLTARMLGGIVPITLELLEDAANVDAVVMNSITQAVALEIDRAALLGSGSSNQPTGIQNTSGILTTATVGTPTSYSKFAAAVWAIKSVNGTPNAIILSPRTAGTIDGLVDSLGQPLRKPDSLADMPFLDTNQIPNNLGGGTNESLAFVGQWNNLMIGIRNNMLLEISREGADSAGLGFSTGHVLVRFYLRADVQVAHPNHFNLMSGILA